MRCEVIRAAVNSTIYRPLLFSTKAPYFLEAVDTCTHWVPTFTTSFTGYRGVKAKFTYSWKPVNNTDFAVCVVVANNELDTKVLFR